MGQVSYRRSRRGGNAWGPTWLLELLDSSKKMLPRNHCPTQIPPVLHIAWSRNWRQWEGQKSQPVDTRLGVEKYARAKVAYASVSSGTGLGQTFHLDGNSSLMRLEHVGQDGSTSSVWRGCRGRCLEWG